VKLLSRSALTTAALLLTVVGSIVAELVVAHNRNNHKDVFSGRTLHCVLALENDVAHKGLHGNFNYELLSSLSKSKNCKLDVQLADEYWQDSLRTGAIDIAIVEKGYSIDNEDFIYACTTDSLTKWTMYKDNIEMRHQIVSWFKEIKKSGQYYRIHDRFFTHYDPHRKHRKDQVQLCISPYDSLIKVYADSINWDWRLLAAIIYRESRFSILSNSNKGAAGLMQVMPKNARNLGVENLLDPQENISAGSRLLAKLYLKYKSYGYSDSEALKFTLAAYNAGSGRIRDCICLADALGYDKKKWDDIVSIIPFMSKLDSLDCSDTVRLGTFKGGETIGYVKGVLSTYGAFCKITDDPIKPSLSGRDPL